MGWKRISRHGFGDEANNKNLRLAFLGNELFASVTNSTTDQVEIWKCFPTALMSATLLQRTWRRVATLSSSRRVDCMTSYGGHIIVGDTQSRLFRLSSRGRPIPIPVPASSGALGVSALYRTIEVERSSSGFFTRTERLYAVFSGRPLKVFRTESLYGDSWDDVTPPFPSGSGARYFSGLLTSVGGALFIGTGKESPGGSGGGGEIWKRDPDGLWTQWITDGLGTANLGAYVSFAVRNNRLIAATQDHIDGSRVYSIGTDIPDSYSQLIINNTVPIRAMLAFRGRIYAGEGNNPLGAGLFIQPSPGAEFVIQPERFSRFQPTTPGSGESYEPLFIQPLLSTSDAGMHPLYAGTHLYRAHGAAVWIEDIQFVRPVGDIWFVFLPLRWMIRRIPLIRDILLFFRRVPVPTDVTPEPRGPF